MRQRWIDKLGVTHFVWQTALCICALSDVDVEPALEWMGRRRRWKLRRCGIKPWADRDHLRRELERALLEQDASYVYSWIDSNEAALGRGPLRLAERVCRDATVKTRIKQRTDEFGVPVPTDDMLELWNSSRSESSVVGAHLRDAGRTTHGNYFPRTWASRYRKRSGVKRGFCRTKEPMPLVLKRSKAPRANPTPQKRECIF